MKKKSRKPRKIEIFKIQKPLEYPKGTTPMALVYNRDRSILFQIPMNVSAELAEIMGESYKIYIQGYIEDNEFYTVGEPINTNIHPIKW